MTQDTAAAAGTVDVSTLEITTETEFHEAPPFLGEMVIDEFTPGKYGPQYHVAVKPLEYTLGGQTGAFHTYLRVPEDLRKRSGMYLFVEAWKAAFTAKRPDGTAWPFGKGQLNGTKAWFVRKDLEFGKNKSTGDTIKIEGALLPVRVATPEELARVGSGGPALTPAAPSWTDADLGAVLDLVAGKKPLEYQRAAAKAAGLSPELKNAVLNGDAIRALEAKGLAEVQGDGMVIRHAWPAAA